MHHLLSSLLAITLLSTAAIAAPTELQGRSYKVQRQRYELSTPQNGAAALNKAYGKYGWTPPDLTTPEVSNTAVGTKELSVKAGTSKGSVNAAQPLQGDAEFLSPVTIGGQKFNMDFDTGSSDLWVFNTALPSGATKGRTNVYDPSKSPTFKKIPGSSFSIRYGDKSKAQGTVGLDTINVGGATAQGQAIELATSVTDGFIKDTKSDGLLGLGFQKINTVVAGGRKSPQKTFFENIQSSLAEPVFTANLKHSTVGAYQFGQVDKTQFTGQIAFTPVDSSQGFWQFHSTSFAVGSGSVQSNPQASPAIADTGTSLLLVDDAVVKAYYAQVQGQYFDAGQNGVAFPCDAQLPDFHVALGDNYMATIPGALMSFSTVSGSDNMCFGGIQSNLGQPLQILGDIMFKSQFVVFDGGNTRIGFAPHA